jgi:hypothetical protein
MATRPSASGLTARPCTPHSSAQPKGLYAPVLRILQTGHSPDAPVLRIHEAGRSPDAEEEEECGMHEAQDPVERQRPSRPGSQKKNIGLL